MPIPTVLLLIDNQPVAHCIGDDFTSLYFELLEIYGGNIHMTLPGEGTRTIETVEELIVVSEPYNMLSYGGYILVTFLNPVDASGTSHEVIMLDVNSEAALHEHYDWCGGNSYEENAIIEYCNKHHLPNCV